MDTYDVLVIGGGPGGYLAAERAAQGGLHVALFEKKHLGGTCLNVGCIPSKAFLSSAKIYNHAKLDGKKFGVEAESIGIDHQAVIARKNKVVSTLVNGVARTLKKLKVNVIRGGAKIEGRENGLFIISCEGVLYAARDLIVSTGSTTIIPPIDGLQESIASGFALTNETMFDLPDVPKHLIVLGGGVIGMEMASYFKAAGSQVDVIEMMTAVGGSFGAEMSELLEKDYESKGFVFHLGCRVTKVSDHCVFYRDANGNEQSIAADKVLVSLGRRPNTEGLGLEKLNVYMERGAIVVDERIASNVPGLYAPGDVNGKAMLAHIAYREAEVAVNNILGKKDTMSYRIVPNILYTDPEIACVGETPESARSKGYEVKTVSLPMQYSGRYVAETEDGNGICTLVYDAKNDRLLGAQVCATGSSEFIFAVGALIDLEVSLDRIKKLIFPHPTTGEIIREALFEL